MRITVDRRPAAVLTGVLGLTSAIVGLVIIENSMPIDAAAAYTILATSLGGTLALARMSWARTTRRLRARAAALMDAVTQALIETAPESASSDNGGGSRTEGA